MAENCRPPSRAEWTSVYTYSVSKKKSPLRFTDIFPKWLGVIGPNFTGLLYVPIYTRLHIFIQLSPTLTKLCHIVCDHPAWTFWAYDGGRT